MPRDEFDRLRWSRDEPRPPSPGPGGGGSPAFVGRVTTTGTTYLGRFCLVSPVVVLGTEVEGGAGSLTADTTVSIPVYLVGPGPVQAGDDLVVRWSDYRWVAEKGGPTIPSYTCAGNPIPAQDLFATFSYTKSGGGTGTVAMTLAWDGTCRWNMAGYINIPDYSGIASCSAGPTSATIRHWFGLFCDTAHLGPGNSPGPVAWHWIQCYASSFSPGITPDLTTCDPASLSSSSFNIVAYRTPGATVSYNPFSFDMSVTPGSIYSDLRMVVTQ